MAQVEEGATVGATLIVRLDVSNHDIEIGHLDIEVELSDEVGESGNRVAYMRVPETMDAIRELIIDVGNGDA